MKRGEVWWINFDLSVGGEIRKKRPAKLQLGLLDATLQN